MQGRSQEDLEDENQLRERAESFDQNRPEIELPPRALDKAWQSKGE